jgi:Cu+-exporting ATPase
MIDSTVLREDSAEHQDATHQHSHLTWPLSGRARAGVLVAAAVTLLLNATGLFSSVFGIDTAIIVAVLGAYPLGLRAFESIRMRQLNYDVTISVAAIIAALAGEFLAAAEVVIIVQIGDALEHWAMHRADRAIAGLLSVQPDRASVIRDGREQLIPAADVRLTDCVVVRGGERIPVDGVIVDGEALVDQALVTGESVPVSKTVGAAAFCGSILEHGSVQIRPELVGRDTTVARIGRLVRDAKRRRSPLVRTADKLSRVFLPAILASAVVVYLLTGEALRAAAVLLVACSCALVYAAPAAFAAALARLARDGVLVKGGDALEALSAVTAVAFDKTGTLTVGRPRVTDVIAGSGFSADDALRLAASLEDRSEHAFGRAIVAEAASRQLDALPVESFTSRPGLGVAGRVNGHDVIVGSVSFLREALPTPTSEIEALVARSTRGGETHIVVAVDNQIAALLSLQDVARPDAAEAIAALAKAGIKDAYLLTGDGKTVAESIARQVGIDLGHVHANLLPEDKLRHVRELASAGAKLLMVGDGVNDAPSLAAAHVGAAFGRGAADLSAEAAQVVILEPRLHALAEAIVFARKTVRRVRFNIIAFAVGVNALAILAAGFGYLKPAASAVLHQIVSLVVILGSVSLLIEHRLRDPRAWSEWRQGLSGLAERLSTRVGAAVSQIIERHGPLLARGALAATAFAWLGSGVVALGPSETATVQRFGRLVNARLEPGLHVRAPWPIERVTRIASRRVRILELGFRSPLTRSSEVIDLDWSSPHGEGQVQQVAEENLVLTGDENMCELYAVVHYAIANPATFLFTVRDGEALVRMEAEGTLRSLAASYPLDTMLTTERRALEDRWAAMARTRLAQIDAGVEILGIHLADVHPPVEVVDAFRDVASAEEERVMKVNEADAYSKESIPISRGNAKAQLEEAAGYKAGLVNRSLGDASRFLARIAQVGTTSLAMFRLQLETIDAALSGKRVVILDDHAGGRRTLVFFGGSDLLSVLATKPAVSGDEEDR